MGFDKPDLGFVVHVGCAQRRPWPTTSRSAGPGAPPSGPTSCCCPGPEDQDIWRYFASVSMPREEQASAVLAALAQAGRPLSTAAIETIVDIRRTRLELLLKVLDVDGAVNRVSGGWIATGAPWTYDGERYAWVAQQRQAEQEQMLAYERGAACRMAFLQHALDDDSAADCGRCDNCAGPWYPTEIPDRVIGAAREQLARVGRVIEPRAMWPTGMDRLGVPVRGKIAAQEQAEDGRVLARLSDLGWGQRLRPLLQRDGPVPPEVLSGVVQVLTEWGWAQRPVAVVAIPSRARPALVTSLAQGIAEIGRLRYLGTLDVIDGGPAGEPGGNSAFRLANVWERLAVGLALADALAGIPGPILLVDDFVSSRWTVTEAARALRRAGAPAVLPVALAIDG
jgi:ATP-dependent DNA helicase RecQ